MDSHTNSRVRTAGAYIIRDIVARPRPVDPKTPPPGYSVEITDEDRALARALMALKGRG